MRVAVVASRYGDPWEEQAVLARRLAGALACSAEVDVLLPGRERTTARDGAVRLLKFSSMPLDPTRRRAWQRATLGQRDGTLFSFRPDNSPRWDLPALAEEELVRAEGGDAPELYEYLRQVPYDLVVFVGYHSPATCWGVKALPKRRRFVLVPGRRGDPSLELRIHDESFERAERVAVSTKSEADLITPRVGGDNRIVNLGFVVGVNYLAQTTAPHDYHDTGHHVVIAADWTSQPPPTTQVLHLAERLASEVDADLKPCLVGPGAESLPFGMKQTGARLDVWRWVCRSLAVLDPLPHRLLGQEVLEAFLFGVPVVTNAEGGASREHAEAGNGGLWYRTDNDLCAVLRALLDDDLRRTLGDQGQRYAEDTYADTDAYLKRVANALLS